MNDNEINDLFRSLPPCGSESGLDSVLLESSLSYCSYREGQEDQLGALGLVLNIIILWNTLYISAALDQLAAEGYPIQPADVARLSPLVFEHINLLGRYAFSIPDAVVQGELRPLRRPEDGVEDAA